MLNIDGAEPAQLAEFYTNALGWTSAHCDNDYGVAKSDGIKLGFGKIQGFQLTPWPDQVVAKRLHLDLLLDGLDSATERLCATAASQPSFQPGADRWQVLLDPSSQPFCLSQRPVPTF